MSQGISEKGGHRLNSRPFQHRDNFQKLSHVPQDVQGVRSDEFNGKYCAVP
jgi:hypothetical protein